MNERHLNWLANYVEATLRTVSRTEQGYSNHALQSRIPKWISSGSNRPKVMAGIEKLRRRLEEHGGRHEGGRRPDERGAQKGEP